MLKTTIFLTILLASLKVGAQDYLINFEGKGDTNAVEKVKVDNLTKKLSVTINGTDILHLMPTLGIQNKESTIPQVLVFPNPSIEKCFITFNTPGNGEVAINITDFSGRIVQNITFNVSSGLHRFQIKGLGKGMYVLSVSGNNFTYSTKLLSLDCSQAKPQIDYLYTEHNEGNSPLKSYSSIINMPYTDGDQLLFTCQSGNYTTIVPLVPTKNMIVPALFANCTDGSNNHYPVVSIGSQLWMEENLKTTRFNNGVLIPEVTDQSSWSQLSGPGMCWYKNDPKGPFTYGGLYNGYAAQACCICPSGWRVPTEKDFTYLNNFVGGTPEAGKKLKESGIGHWLYSEKTSATNEYGFTALPAGYRHTGGSFVKVSQNGYWWSATPTSSDNAWCISMSYESALLNNFDNHLLTGKSIRCIKE